MDQLKSQISEEVGSVGKLK